MKFGQTLGKAIAGLVIIASPFSIVISHSVQAAEVVRSLSLEERVERLEKQQQIRNKSLVEIQYKLSDLQDEIRNLLGTQEENNYRLNQLTERQRDIYKDVDRRLTEAQQSLNNMTTSPGTTSSLYKAPTTKSQTTATATSTTRNEAEAYEKIFPLVRGKKYAQAITAYQQFLANYPASKYSANAHYWLGQVHYVQSQLEPAIRQFQLVSDKFASSSKAPDALLKLGIIYMQQNKTEEAKAMFSKLSREFPGTSSSRIAERRLKELNGSE
jgi:tol-pal system protein YbgF